MAAAIAELSKLFGQDAVAFTMQFIQNGCKAELQEIPGLLQRIKMDGLVVDRIAPGTRPGDPRWDSFTPARGGRAPNQKKAATPNQQ